MENALIVFLYIFNLVLFFIYPYWFVLRKKEPVRNFVFTFFAGIIPCAIGSFEYSILSKYVFIGLKVSEIREIIPTFGNPLFVIISFAPAKFINIYRICERRKKIFDKAIDIIIEKDAVLKPTIAEKPSQGFNQTTDALQQHSEKTDVFQNAPSDNQSENPSHSNEKLSKKDNSTTIVLTIFLIISVFLNIYIYYAFNISTLKYYDESVVFLVDNDPLYHKYKCPYIDTSKEYHLVNKEFALYYDYAPCEECN